MLQSSDADTLKAEASRLSDVSTTELLSSDADRVSDLTLTAAGLSLDASKQRIDRAALSVLTQAAENAGLSEAFEQLVTGVEVNITEQRAALHTLLRGTAAADCADLHSEVSETLSRMKSAVAGIHSGAHTSASGQPFTDVINVGIGCLLYTSPSPRDLSTSRMPSSA